MNVSLWPAGRSVTMQDSHCFGVAVAELERGLS